VFVASKCWKRPGCPGRLIYRYGFGVCGASKFGFFGAPFESYLLECGVLDLDGWVSNKDIAHGIHSSQNFELLGLLVCCAVIRGEVGVFVWALEVRISS
jgi:hypothetical protein